MSSGKPVNYIASFKVPKEEVLGELLSAHEQLLKEAKKVCLCSIDLASRAFVTSILELCFSTSYTDLATQRTGNHTFSLATLDQRACPRAAKATIL